MKFFFKDPFLRMLNWCTIGPFIIILFPQRFQNFLMHTQDYFVLDPAEKKNKEKKKNLDKSGKYRQTEEVRNSPV